MSWRQQLSKLGALFRGSKPVDDLEEEIRAHLEMRFALISKWKSRRTWNPACRPTKLTMQRCAGSGT